MNKQKIIAFVTAIVIIIVGGIILNVLKKERVPEGPISVEELSGFLQIVPIDWHNPEKPMSSLPLEEEEIPEQAIRIGITAQGFSPSSFEVNKGEEIVLSVTSQDKWSHLFKFKNSSLAEVAVAVASGETRVITFYAPSEPGEYPFFCFLGAHENRGEKGVMIVK